MDCTWGKLVQYTLCKAESAGRIVVLVDPRNTSKMCSCCEKMVEKDLSVRVHECPYCGLTMDRILNAVKNILRLGLQSLPINGQMPANLLAGVVTSWGAGAEKTAAFRLQMNRSPLSITYASPYKDIYLIDLEEILMRRAYKFRMYTNRQQQAMLG